MDFNPKVLTVRRSHIVSNQALAQLCALSGLHRHMRFTLASVQIAISNFVKQLDTECEVIDQNGMGESGTSHLTAVSGDETFTARLRPGWRDSKRVKHTKSKRQCPDSDVNGTQGGMVVETSQEAVAIEGNTQNEQNGTADIGRYGTAHASEADDRMQSNRLQEIDESMPPAHGDGDDGGDGWGIIGNAGKKRSSPSSDQADAADDLVGGDLSDAALADGPKLLADLVEAVLGAVLIDSGGDLSAVWGAYRGLVKAAES